MLRKASSKTSRKTSRDQPRHLQTSPRELRKAPTVTSPTAPYNKSVLHNGRCAKRRAKGREKCRDANSGNFRHPQGLEPRKPSTDRDRCTSTRVLPNPSTDRFQHRCTFLKSQRMLRRSHSRRLRVPDVTWCTRLRKISSIAVSVAALPPEAIMSCHPQFSVRR